MGSTPSSEQDDRIGPRCSSVNTVPQHFTSNHFSTLPRPRFDSFSSFGVNGPPRTRQALPRRRPGSLEERNSPTLGWPANGRSAPSRDRPRHSLLMYTHTLAITAHAAAFDCVVGPLFARQIPARHVGEFSLVRRVKLPRRFLWGIWYQCAIGARRRGGLRAFVGRRFSTTPTSRLPARVAHAASFSPFPRA